MSFETDARIGDPVVALDDLQARVKELGQEITKDYAGKSPVLICVLKGGFVFASDLMREIDLHAEIDFMAVSSYGAATKSSGVVRIVKDIETDLSGRDVIIVEDVVDSGLTLAYLKKYLMARQPASLEVCALLVKTGIQKVDPKVRYVGFSIPPDFVIGYGLDVAERYRNLAYVARYLGDQNE